MNKPASLLAALLLASAVFIPAANASLSVSHNQQQIGIIGPTGESERGYSDEELDSEAARASAAAFRVTSAGEHTALGNPMANYR